MSELADSREFVLSVKKAFAILRAVAEAPGDLSVVEIARATGLGRPATHRLVATLEDEGALERVVGTSKFRIGMGAFAIGNAAVAQSSLREEVARHLSVLAQQTQDATCFVVESHLRALCLERINGDFPVQGSRPAVGDTTPLYCGGASFALFSFLPDEKIEAVLRGPLDPMTPRTETDPQKIRQRIAEARARGITLGDEDAFEHVVSVGAPVFGYGGRLLGAISASGLKFRYSPARVREVRTLVARTAAAISARLGFTDTIDVWKERHAS